MSISNKECKNEMIKQFKYLQWECTVEEDAIAIVKECFSKLESDHLKKEEN